MKLIKWKYKPSNNCPIQAEGHFMNYYFYFRARYDTATIEFSKTEAGWENNLIHARYILLTTKGMYAAGWLPKWKCRLLIWVGCFRFIFKRNKQKTIK
jgi:hypothetical protein